MNEIEIANEFLNATDVNTSISRYSQWCSLYGEKKWINSELGKIVKTLRKAFWHNGSDKAINLFKNKHKELKNYLNYNNK